MNYIVNGLLCFFLVFVLGACALKTSGTFPEDMSIDGTVDFSDTDAVIDVIDDSRDILPDDSDGPACPEGQTACGGVCVDLMTDRNHCGDCAVACEGLEQCVDGGCICPGEDGYLDCGGVCVDTYTDNNNCGSCGHACVTPSFCNGSGSCDTECYLPFTLCNPGPDAYCADLQTDPANCNTCGNACTQPSHSIAVCESGNCTSTCEPDWVDVNGDDSDGCECHRTSLTDACDGIDNNCDGQPDETFACVQNTGTRGCEHCGTQTCDASCNWGSCITAGDCDTSDPDETQPCCGGSGIQTRTCLASCTWGDWSGCSFTGCTPGETQSQNCCSTGTQTRTCLDNCTWGDWDACNVTGVCIPEQRRCANFNYDYRVCQASCAWGGAISCGDDPESCCNPADGSCYSHSHTCPYP